MHPSFAMLPHIDMGGYKGKVREISGKVHFFLDAPSKMLFEVCRICSFVGLLAHPSSFLVIVLACPCLLFLACPWDDASCDVVANRGRYHRWSPPRDYDFSKMCLLACVYARVHQRFRTFCFHNLHMLPLFCHRLSIETRELRQKTWEIF